MSEEQEPIKLITDRGEQRDYTDAQSAAIKYASNFSRRFETDLKPIGDEIITFVEMGIGSITDAIKFFEISELMAEGISKSTVWNAVGLFLRTALGDKYKTLIEENETEAHRRAGIASAKANPEKYPAYTFSLRLETDLKPLGDEIIKFFREGTGSLVDAVNYFDIPKLMGMVKDITAWSAIRLFLKRAIPDEYDQLVWHNARLAIDRSNKGHPERYVGRTSSPETIAALRAGFHRWQRENQDELRMKNINASERARQARLSRGGFDYSNRELVALVVELVDTCKHTEGNRRGHTNWQAVSDEMRGYGYDFKPAKWVGIFGNIRLNAAKERGAK